MKELGNSGSFHLKNTAPSSRWEGEKGKNPILLGM